MTWDDDNDDEVPEHLRDPNYLPFDHLDTTTQDLVYDVQKRNMKYLENDPRIKIAAGAQLYIGSRGVISTFGMRPLTRDDLSKPQLDFMWGPGAEASVALRLLNKAPDMKHMMWSAVQKVLCGIPPQPDHAPAVISLLNSAIAVERRSWKQLRALESAQTLKLVADLDMDSILALMRSLAGVAFGGEDPIEAVEKVDYALSDDMALLRRYHQRLKLLSHETDSQTVVARQTYITILEQMDRFKEIWTGIVQKLFPGRLAKDMQKYVDKMQLLYDTDERYSASQNEGRLERNRVE